MSTTATKKKGDDEILMNLGHPLMRHNNIIYYGSMSDRYIIMMQILETTQVKDLEVATKVSVQLQQTSPSVRPQDRIVKKAVKKGLFSAMDIAVVWLKRALTAK